MALLKSFEPRSHLQITSATIPDLTGEIVRPDDWQYCAAGGFGDVFRCRYQSDDGIEEVAVKAFRFSFSIDHPGHKHDGDKATRMIRRELGIWRRLSHRNIVRFLGVSYGFGKQGNVSLVSIWMPHGTLHAFLEAHDDFLTVAHRLQLLSDIVNGLHYLHSFPMIHGDLTSSNILLDHNYIACLTDFGCASLVGELPEGLTYLKASTTKPGTLRWAAPEHFSLTEGTARHTIKSDIYSFGNIALLVLSGKYPWSEIRVDAAVVIQLSRGLNPARPLERPIDDQHWSLIQRCWSSVPERPLAEDIMSSLQELLAACPSQSTLRDLLPISSTATANRRDQGDGDPSVEAVLNERGNIQKSPILSDDSDAVEGASSFVSLSPAKQKKKRIKTCVCPRGPPENYSKCWICLCYMALTNLWGGFLRSLTDFQMVYELLQLFRLHHL